MADTPPLLLQDDRVGFRPFVLSDLKALRVIEYDPFVKAFIGVPEKSQDVWLQQAQNLPSFRDQFAIVDIETQCLAGRLSLPAYGSLPGAFEIQLVLAREFLGKGLGRAVCRLACDYTFNELDAQLIVGLVHEKHTASLAMMAAFGFAEDLRAPDGRRVFRLYRQQFECASSGENRTPRSRA